MERPEETKKAIEPIVEKIPDKLLNPIIETQKLTGQLANEFHQTSLRLAGLQQHQQELFGKMQTNNQSSGNKIIPSLRYLQ